MAGRSTKSKTTRPPASPSAVSTESVSRCFADRLTASRSMTTSMVCFFCLSRRGRIGQRVGLAIDAGSREALALQLPEEVDVLALATADDRRQYLEPHALVERQDPVDDLLRRLPRDRRTAHGAMRAARAGEQQSQVVIDLGDRAHGRARVARGGLLVDRDRGREPLDEVDVGLVHLAEELASVRRQRLDVATLTLGEDRVEREAGLARPGQPGEDDHGVARQVERNVLEVVLARTPDDQLVSHYFPFATYSLDRNTTHDRPQPHSARQHRQNAHRRGRGDVRGKVLVTVWLKRVERVSSFEQMFVSLTSRSRAARLLSGVGASG